MMSYEYYNRTDIYSNHGAGKYFNFLWWEFQNISANTTTAPPTITMKKIPTIYDQEPYDACQSFAIAQYLNTAYKAKIAPLRLYFESVSYNKDRTPGIFEVCNYLKDTNVIHGYNRQKIGRNNIFRFLGDTLLQFITNSNSIVVARNMCDHNGGGIISVCVPEAWQINTDGILTEEQIKNNKGREHAMYLYDYNDEKRLFTLVNSWGKDYGDGTGCLYLPYDLIHLTNNCITISYNKQKLT